VKSPTLGRSAPVQILIALLCAALGVGIGIADPTLTVASAFAGATGILMALFWGRLAYLYFVLYGIGYGTCRFYLEYSAWH